jgi:hypothetical protein
MSRKYIRLCLSVAELDRIVQEGIKLNAIAHKAIANWETINSEQQQQIIKLRQILYINETPTIKTIGSDRVISNWFANSQIANESLTLSSAIGLVLAESLPDPHLVVPIDLADRLRLIGGDPLEHLAIAINKYLINC